MNPCNTCGACCSTFRVSFYWAEADDAAGGQVPAALTTSISPHLRAMRGTDQKNPRCVALTGEVGSAVSCEIYEKRPSTCREFECHTAGKSTRCNEARLVFGLPPLISS